MNTHELERMLGDDLHRQVDGMTRAPFDLGHVKGRARRIRRNRRVAAGVAVAAALAVIVPTSITAGGMLEGTDEIQPAPSPNVPDAPAEVARTTLTTSGLSRGDAPAIEYFTPDGVVLPDGRTQQLSESYQALTPGPGDGWIAVGPGGDEVVYLSEDFERQGSTPSTSAFTTTPQRDYMAWSVLEGNAQTIYLRSDTTPDDLMSWGVPTRPVVDRVDILGPDSVVYETTDSRGRTTVSLATPDGTTELPYLSSVAADPVNGRIAVQTKTQGLVGGCFAVVEVATSKPAWETCKYALGTFSPDGRYVMATSVESDGQGPSSLYVLDAAAGTVVAEFESQGRNLVALVRPAWESADAIVATAAGGPVTTMVRMRVDGTLEEVADPVESSAYDDLYYWIGQDRAGL